MSRTLTTKSSDRGGASAGGNRRSRRGRAGAHSARGTSRPRSVQGRAVGTSANHRDQLQSPTSSTPTNGHAYKYAAADVLSLPSLAGISGGVVPRNAPSVGLGNFAEALMGAGVVHEMFWTGSLAETIRDSVEDMSLHETGMVDHLQVLTWWELEIAQDVAAIEWFYNPTEADQELCQHFKAGSLAAFAIEGASSGSTSIGGPVLGLSKILKSCRIRPDLAVKKLIGAISCALEDLRGWSPASARDEWECSDWYEIDEQNEAIHDAIGIEPYNHRLGQKQWDELPSYIFSTELNPAGLDRIAQKLKGTGRDTHEAYWTFEYAAELARAVAAYRADDRCSNHMIYVMNPSAPSFAISWSPDREPDAVSHWYDNEHEALIQSEHHGLSWLYTFNASSPESTRKAVHAVRAILRVVGALDRCLSMLLQCEEAWRRMDQGKTLMQIFAPQVQVGEATQRIRVRV